MATSPEGVGEGQDDGGEVIVELVEDSSSGSAIVEDDKYEDDDDDEEAGSRWAGVAAPLADQAGCQRVGVKP